MVTTTARGSARRRRRPAVPRRRLAVRRAGLVAALSTPALLLLGAVAVTAAPAAAQDAGRDGSARSPCSGRAERCGAGVVIDDGLRGVNNCRIDPNCRTRRIVDNHDPGRGTDFIPVPDWPGGGSAGAPGGSGAGSAAPGPGGAGDGAADEGHPTAGGADGRAPAPRCMPRAAGRAAPDFAQAGLPQGRVGANPLQAQLTGLESWFWYEGPTTARWQSPVYVGITADCRVIPAPPPVTYEAEIVAFTWRIEDGTSHIHHAAGPGSEAAPAVRHTYETKGTSPVAVTCTWRGGWGAEAQVACARRDLEVVEVRGRFQRTP